VRLLTLTGPGGVGKTRLALALAEQALPQYSDAVFVVFLASLGDPLLVPSVVAHTLGVREWAGGAPEETLVAYLSERDVLLVLDNFEHLLDAAPTVSRLLSSARGLTVLVTSREPLHVTGEHVFEVPPLSVPDKVPLTVAEALQHDSVALFFDRAAAAKADFEFSGDTIGAVAEICARLDGLPLAIELAAARSRTLSPQALVARLDSSLVLLTSGARDSDERQRTLRATIEWSHDLLSEPEKTLFARLAAFAGGCRPEEAEAVCNSAGELGMDIIDALATLLDKSLLRQRADPDGEPRFWMLETIREYADERLQERGELDEVRQRHAETYFALAERAVSGLRGGQIADWLDRLEREMDNLRTLLAWSLEHDELDSAIRFAAALWDFWWLKGHAEELRRWSQAALAEPGRLSREAEAAGRWLLAEYSLVTDEYPSAEENYRSSLALYERLGDREGIAMCLNGLGRLALPRGDYDEGERMLRKGLAIARELGSAWHLAFALRHLASVLAAQGDHVGASALLEEALAVARQIDDIHMVEEILNDSAWYAFLQRNYERAIPVAEESLALVRRLGAIPDIGAVAHTLGAALLERGESGEASMLLVESLVLCDQIGDLLAFESALYSLAALAAASEYGHDAARLQGAADASLQATGGALVAAFLSICEEHLAPARADLGEELWEAEYQKGRTMRRPEVISFVRQSAAAWSGDGDGSRLRTHSCTPGRL
jgi:predicted ATPase